MVRHSGRNGSNGQGYIANYGDKGGVVMATSYSHSSSDDEDSIISDRRPPIYGKETRSPPPSPGGRGGGAAASFPISCLLCPSPVMEESDLASLDPRSSPPEPECDYDSNPTILYRALQKRHWPNVVRRCTFHPNEARIWILRRETPAYGQRCGRIRWRLLPLHAAIIFQAPPEIVEELLIAYPQSARARDDQGMLPIHLAFRYPAPPPDGRRGSSSNAVSTEDAIRVMEILFSAYPGSVREKDKRGRTALIHAQGGSGPRSAIFIQIIQKWEKKYQRFLAGHTQEDGGGGGDGGPSGSRDPPAALEGMTVKFDGIEEVPTGDMGRRQAADLAELRAAKLLAQASMGSAAGSSPVRGSAPEQQPPLTAGRPRDTGGEQGSEAARMRAELTRVRHRNTLLADHSTSLEAKLEQSTAREVALGRELRSLHADMAASRETKATHDALLAGECDAVLEENARLRSELSARIARGGQDRRSEDEKRTSLLTRVAEAESRHALAAAAALRHEATAKEATESERRVTAQLSDLVGALDASADSERRGEEVRRGLAATVEELTGRLGSVAGPLEDLLEEQERILDAASAGEAAVTAAGRDFRSLVGRVRRQQQDLVRSLRIAEMGGSATAGGREGEGTAAEEQDRPGRSLPAADSDGGTQVMRRRRVLEAKREKERLRKAPAPPAAAAATEGTKRLEREFSEMRALLAAASAGTESEVEVFGVTSASWS